MKCFLRAFIAPIFFCLFFTLYPNFSFADTSKIINIVFTEDSATSVAVGVPSESITVQAQNIFGTGEKMDISGGKLTLTSSSQSGEFSASLTSWAKIIAPLTVNSNWTGRTFYYKNSQGGIDTLTAVLNVDGKTFPASQAINVGGISPTSTTSNDNATTNVESHTAVEELTTSEDDSVTTFTVGAGRERVAYVGSPVIFKANYKQTKSLTGNKKFNWNFGDGYSGTGENISHSYKHSGEYEVVLNASIGDSHGSSRTKVTVLETNLAMSILSDESVSLENLGKYEVNIGGFRLKSYYRDYTFPQDTIIGVGKKIIFDKDCTKLSVTGNMVEFLDPQSKVLLSYIPVKEHQEGNFVLGTTTQNISLEDSGKKDLVSAEEVAKLVEVLTLINNEKVVNNTVQAYQTPKDEPLVIVIASSSDESAPLVQENKTSFWSKVLHFPATIFYGFFGAFYQNN